MAPDDTTDSKQNAYICSYCGKGFPIRNKLNMHLLDHTGETRFLCNVCGRGFKRNAGLQQHLKTHGGPRPFMCSVCNKSFLSKYSCALHLRTHTREKPEICAYCGERFRFPMDLNIHGKSGHPEVPSGHHICVKCNKSFTSLSEYSRHMLVTHQSHNNELLLSESEVSVAAEIIEKVPESDTMPLEKNYGGTVYGAEDTFECSASWDGMEEEEEPTELEEKPTAQQSMPNNQENNPTPTTTSIKTLPDKPMNSLQKPECEENTESNITDKLTPCPFCNTAFAGLIKLKVHMLTHMKDWQHMCQECGKECSSAAELQTHMNEHREKGISTCVSSDLAPQKCTQPSDDVTVKSECPSHEDDQGDKDLNQMSDVESNSNPQPKTEYDSDTEEDTREDECLKPVPSKKSWTIGKKLHVAGFTCECGKVYKSESGYREHHLRVHQKVYRYMCVVCGKKFLSKPAWKSHELAHMKIKQFGCDKCDAEYQYKKDLIKHQEKHLGLTYKCTNCNGTYSTSTSLAKHQERCVENITYQCPECPYVASYKTNLRRHKKTMHKDTYEEDFKLKDEKAEQLKALEAEAFKTIKAEELGQAPMLKQERVNHVFKLECECGKVFTTEGGLRDHHMRVHQKSFRHSCAICDKKFMSRTAWEGHELSHQQIKRFPCDECDAKYTYKKDLVIHMAKHRGQRFECTQCNHSFSTPNTLRKHQLICIEGKMHYCTKCPYIANYKQNLKRHMKNKH